MIRYEYYRFPVDETGTSDVLNTMGMQGWRAVCQVTSRFAKFPDYLLFTREVEEAAVLTADEIERLREESV